MRTNLLVVAGFVIAAMGSMPVLADTSEFLTKAIKGDNSEMKLGALAARQGRSVKVKRFGAMLEHDHGKAKAQATPVAAKHGVVVPTEMADEAQAEFAKLRGMHGAAFDHEFGRYMVEDHKKDIADFEKEAASKDPADVRGLARKTLPALRKHLATAQAIG